MLTLLAYQMTIQVLNVHLKPYKGILERDCDIGIQIITLPLKSSVSIRTTKYTFQNEQIHDLREVYFKEIHVPHCTQYK